MNNNANGSCTFTDQDRMEDLLAQEKYLIDGYSTFIPEASCPQLRQVLCDNLNGCFNDQYAVFDKISLSSKNGAPFRRPVFRPIGKIWSLAPLASLRDQFSCEVQCGQRVASSGIALLQ